LISLEQGYAHPTLFPVMLALLWKVFGPYPVIGHYLTLPFLPILLISAYFYLKSKTDQIMGLLGSILLGFTPVILAEYVNVYTDLPMAALVALSLLFWSKRKYAGWAIAFAAAILIKIPALAIAPYFFLEAVTRKNKQDSIKAGIVPIVTSAVWFIYHFISTGWWFKQTVSNAPLAIASNSSQALLQVFQIVASLLLGQGRWATTLLAVLGIILLVLKKQMRKSDLIELTPLITAACIFAATGEFGFRYAIFVYLFYYSFVATIMYKVVTQYQGIRNITYALLIGVILYFGSLWHPAEKALTQSQFNPPNDLGIIDYLQVFRWLTTYIQVNDSPNTYFYGGFPENISLLEPKMGYVSKPANFLPCDAYSYNPNQKQIIIFHPFSPTNFSCYNLIQQNKWQAFTGKEVNGKWVDLFLASSASANLK